MSTSLLTTRRFAPLFWCQFFSAFNDNFLKNSLVFLILYKWAAGPDAEFLITLAGAIFIFPFFILSAIGGEVADRFDKSLVAQRLKLAEIAVAGVAVAGFWYDSPIILFIALWQTATLVVPTRWAIDGLEAMTWRGLGIEAALAPIGVMLAFSAAFAWIAVTRFNWEE